MSEVRRLVTAGVITRNKEPVRDNDAGTFELPAGIARLRDGAKDEVVVSEYVQAVLDAQRWGIQFNDNSVAMLSFQADFEKSQRDLIVPRSFCYMFAAPPRTIGKNQENASFFRIEMHPEECGTLIGEPVVHLHGNRNKAPRFGLSSCPSPLDFLDFIVRNRFPEAWEQNHPPMALLMREMHYTLTHSGRRHQITDEAQYGKVADHLGMMQAQRTQEIPLWGPPPTARRYPFLL